MTDEFPNPFYMRRAAELAALAARTASPNPMVGAVVVKDNVIISEGFHERRGGPHAEAIALSRAGERARGADLYVTLEPCSHQTNGKLTPPCAPLVAACGISRIAIGTLDPNPAVSGNGVRLLRNANIEVALDIETQSLAYLNRGFFSRMSRHRPWVTAKWAMSLDGRTATSSGDSKWITSSTSRHSGHAERAESDAILVGIGTLLADNPMLTARDSDGLDYPRQPLRIVIDSLLHIPLESALVQSAQNSQVIVATGPTSNAEKIAQLESHGVKVIRQNQLDADKPCHIDLKVLLETLGSMNINRVMVEGGASLLGSLADQALMDETLVFLAPSTLIGGASAHPAMLGKGAPTMAAARKAISTQTNINDSGDVETRAQFTNPLSFLPINAG